MASQLSKGHTFHDGDMGVAAATLNSIVDNGTILPGAITEQASALPAVADSFLYSKSNALKKCTLQNILDTIPTSAAAATASLRKLGTAASMAAPGNDTRFPVRLTGIRKGNNVSPDTVAAPKDLSFADINVAALTNIDWDTADQFYASLTGNKTYTFSNLRNGREITVIVKLNGHTVTMPSMDTGTLEVVGTGTVGKIFKFSQSGIGLCGFVVNI